MDGQYQSNEWLKSSLGSLENREAVSIHVTAFYTGAIGRSEYVSASVEQFQKIVADLARMGNPCKVGIVIPLRSKWKKIKLKIPKSVREIFDELDDEPPSLYLETWESCRKYETFEEYRYPIDPGLLLNSETAVKPLNNFLSYYREFRYMEAIKENWEYSRCIYIEYYPGGGY